MEIIDIDIGDAVSRSRYDAFFESCPGAFIQQSTYWADAITGLGPDRPHFLLCSEAGEAVAGLPLYLYENRNGNILTSVPQAGPLGGIFFKEGLAGERLNRAYAALLGRAQEIARTQDCISLTIITSPFFDDLPLYQKYLVPTYIFENFTQYIPLDEMVKAGRIEVPGAEYRNNIKRNLLKSAAHGFAVDIEYDGARLDAWYAIHEKRAGEIGAPALDHRLLKNIVTVLGARRKACLILVTKDGHIASGGIYIWHREVIDLFIISMDSALSAGSPNYLSTERSILLAAAQGARYYNWQSSENRTGGVYQYKKKWGARERPYYFVTKFLGSPERIGRLTPALARAEYPAHYLAPFAALGGMPGVTYFKKGE
ncbi:MAG: GNAT family N-acetyltransferase [Candidatus Omnitrophota bacterium]